MNNLMIDNLNNVCDRLNLITSGNILIDPEMCF